MFSDDIKNKFKLIGEVDFAVTMLSRSKIAVSGVKRILHTGQENIRLKLKNEELFIDGNNLQILEIGGGDVCVEGEIKGVGFEEK